MLSDRLGNIQVGHEICWWTYSRLSSFARRDVNGRNRGRRGDGDEETERCRPWKGWHLRSSFMSSRVRYALCFYELWLLYYPHDINKNTVTLVWTHDQNIKTTYKVEVLVHMYSTRTLHIIMYGIFERTRFASLSVQPRSICVMENRFSVLNL